MTGGWSRSCRLCQAGPFRSVPAAAVPVLRSTAAGVRAFLESTQAPLRAVCRAGDPGAAGVFGEVAQGAGVERGQDVGVVGEGW